MVGCNIAIMKRFLPLLILTGLLFGQDILNLKSGESYTGTFYGKVGEDIVFKVEGETSTKKYSINDVNTIVTKNGELTYPFDIPTKMEPFDFDSNILPKNFVSIQEIINMSEDEKGLLYGNYKVSPLGNTVISFFVPTLGYHRINQWRKRVRSCCGLYFGCAVAIQLAVPVNNYLFLNADAIALSFLQGYHALYLYDVYTQTKRYNRNLSMSIFGQEKPPPSLGSIYPLDSNYKHYFSFFGYPNHRTGLSFFGYSITKRTKKNNEYYMGIGTMIISRSITAGWKYYLKKSNADNYYFGMSLVKNMGETDNKNGNPWFLPTDDDTKKVSMDFIAGNFSAGYEKRLSKNIYLNMEIFTLTGIMPNSRGVTDGIRYLVVPSFHFNYRI